MTSARAPVSVGDAIRALGQLRPTDEKTRSRVLSLLGLEPAGAAETRPRPRPTATARPTSPGRERPAVAREEPEPEEPDEDPSPLGDVVPSSLDVHPRPPGVGIGDVQELPRGDTTSLPTIEPLLRPTWIRGIVSAALSVPLPDGPPDAERIVEKLARLQPLEEIPRRRAPTLRLGVQLLLDSSVRMAPFASDQAWLEHALHRILGEHGVESRAFVGAPPPPDYEPPVAGTPVLLLSDLGIGRPSPDPDWRDPAEWPAFAALVRRAGCPLTAFVPYPPSRWPQRLAGQLTIVQWDRLTSAATIRGTLGPSAR